MQQGHPRAEKIAKYRDTEAIKNMIEGNNLTQSCDNDISEQNLLDFLGDSSEE